MRCCVVFNKTDGFEIVTNTGERTCDPQETLAYIKTHFPDTKDNELNELFEKYKQYAPLQQNERQLSNSACRIYSEKLAALSEHEKLLTDGTIIPDFHNFEYWVKKHGHWDKEKILKLGEEIPAGAILDNQLSDPKWQRENEEINAQKEADRISAMSPDEKQKEISNTLDVLADEAASLEKRAQIQRKNFDPVTWYEEREKALYEKYGLLTVNE